MMRISFNPLEIENPQFQGKCKRDRINGQGNNSAVCIRVSGSLASHFYQAERIKLSHYVQKDASLIS